MREVQQQRLTRYSDVHEGVGWAPGCSIAAAEPAETRVVLYSCREHYSTYMREMYYMMFCKPYTTPNVCSASDADERR